MPSPDTPPVLAALAGVTTATLTTILLTAASVKVNKDKHALIVPAVFMAMFVVSWSMR